MALVMDCWILGRFWDLGVDSFTARSQHSRGFVFDLSDAANSFPLESLDWTATPLGKTYTALYFPTSLQGVNLDEC